MSSTPRSFVHRFEPGTTAGAPPLLLLHGTGGDESDLIGLGRSISPGSALLSPRGRVLENGMPRFFRRLAEGVFDEADVRHRANELGAFLDEARGVYGLDSPVAVGFSNGANIAAALLLLRPRALAGAILFRAMEPLRDAAVADLAGTPVLLLSGAADPMIPADSAGRLADTLARAGAKVHHKIVPGGHGLSGADVTIATDWLKHSAAELGAERNASLRTGSLGQ